MTKHLVKLLQTMKNEGGWNVDSLLDSQDGYSYAKENLGMSKDLGKKTKVLGIP